MPRRLNDFDDYLNKKKKHDIDFELNLKTFGKPSKKLEEKITKKEENNHESDDLETINVEEIDKKGSILKTIRLIFRNSSSKNKENKTKQEIEDIKLYDNYEKVFEDTKALLKKIFSNIDKKELDKLRKTKEFNELAEIFFDQW
ncbi:MAG: hypothetical protein PHT94_00035 [Candidatus Nanoarchaeia archaeon]|nr:hypothetical protein [Candidatus Nanoarchaeia archaeon]